MAGVSVALVLVPQSLAYASIAGLDPVHGLYAAAAAPLAGALVGSSRYLQTGPVAVTSLLTFGALSPLAGSDTSRFALLAAALAVLVGLIRLAVGLLGGGPIAYVMSQPVVVSFTSAAAVLIIGSQLPTLLGVPADAANPVAASLGALSDPAGWSVFALLLGLGAAVLMLAGRRVTPLFPGALLAVLVGSAVSALSGYDGTVVGEIALSLQVPTTLPLNDLQALLLPALVIALIGFAEPAAIARRYAAEDREPWEPNREFVGQGLANVAAGLTGGLPVGGSFSRTALNRFSGARSRWSGAITGLTVVALLPFNDALASLPTAVLAGLVIASALPLVDLRAPRHYWRWSRAQFTVGLVTGLATLAFAPRVERGVILGVVTALAVHLWREMRVEVPFELEEGTLHLRPSGVLYFGSAPGMERTLNRLIADHALVRSVILHLDQIGRVDVTGALMLRDLVQEARAAEITLEIRGTKAPAAALLTRVLGPHAPRPGMEGNATPVR